MSKVVDAAYRFRSENASVLQPNLGQPYSGGNGGGGGDMEQRIKCLEDDVREVKRDLTDIKVTLAEIKSELGHKVGYKWLSIYVLSLAALILREEIAALFKSVG